MEPHWSTRVVHTKEWTAPSGYQRAPKAIAQNIYFLGLFCKFCSSGYIWWPLPACPSFGKSVKKHCFYNVSDALAGPTWGTTRNIKNCKMSATLHGSAPTKKKTSATLHGSVFAGWMVQIGPPKTTSPKQPKPFVSNCFERLLGPV